ncbi:hypothetical protein Tco_0404354 [Tanacetum coccineum]
MDADISLVPPHVEIQEKISDETKVLLEEEEATEIIQDQGSGEKGNKRFLLLTLYLILPMYQLVLPVKLLRSPRSKSKKKGLVMKKLLDYKNRLIRKKEKGLQDEYNKAGKKEAVTEVDTAHNQGGYKMKDFKGMSYDDIRPIFEKVWDQIHSFVPMDSEEEVPRLKRAGQDVKTKLAKRQRTEELNQMVIIVQDEGMNVEALQTKYPRIGWEVYSEDTMQFWKIIRVGNHTEIYQVFEDMLKNFDRDDLDKLWILVQERYNSSGLAEDKEIELWVDLKMLFEPDAEIFLEL